MRLNRYIAACGQTSRRGADELIRSGRISLNGQTVTTMATTVAPGDEVAVDGVVIQLPEQPVIVAWYKPVGVTTTRSDRHADQTLLDVLPAQYHHLKPVGRLDRDSEGLLLLTNDGALAQRLTHPSFGHTKEYIITLSTPLASNDLQRLRRGFDWTDGRAQAVEIKLVSPLEYRITLAQGLKRQIRRMFQQVGHSVVGLKRVRIGRLDLGNLQPGELREVKREEIEG